MPTGRQLVSAAVGGGVVYAMGGNAVENGSATFTDANEAYNPTTNTWATKQAIPEGSRA
jgi:Kelch motif